MRHILTVTLLLSTYFLVAQDGHTDANYYNAKYTEAAEWYGKLVKIDSNDIEPEYYYL